MKFAAELERLANNSRIGTEELLPHGMADNNDTRVIGQIIVGINCLTELRRDLQSREKVRIDGGASQGQSGAIELEFLLSELRHRRE